MKPSSVICSFAYICDKCGNQLWATDNEVSTPGFILVCQCKRIIRPYTIKQIAPVYTNVKQTPKNNALLKKACSYLRQSGYSVTSIKIAVEQIDVDSHSDIQSLIKSILLKINETNNTKRDCGAGENQESVTNLYSSC
jgi:hypothetical protein